MIIGIDLGTTNSLVAVWQDGAPRLIANALGKALTPSVVSVDADGSILVGQAAKERLISHPERTAAAFKRFMGSQKTWSLAGKSFSAQELSALVLGALKQDAETALGEKIDQAVITVPAYFNDHQRKATKLAAEMAGLTVCRLLNEPTAAAMAYGLHQSDQDKQFLVLDLGGGTFDVTLLELFAGVMEVRASAGDNFLGGEDFTHAIMDAFQAAQSQPERFWQPYQGRLYGEAEAAKQRLDEKLGTDMQLSLTEGTYTYHLSPAEFQKISEPLLARIRQPIEQALRDSGTRLSQLDDIVLVGGASRMPLLRQSVARLLGRFPSSKLDPDQTIALGAAIQAGLVARDSALDEVIMTDVCPYTLGIDSSVQIDEHRYESGQMAPIIERNTVIPASREHHFSPVSAQQKQVIFAIYQGESRRVQDNVFLDKIVVDLPSGLKDTREVDLRVRFTYDISGLLEVDIAVTGGKAYNLSIHNQAHALNEAELENIRQKLAALKIHPRDQAENRALIARGERLYAQHLGGKREQIQRTLAQFEAVLEAQNPRDIPLARERLKKIFDALENDNWRD